MSDTNTLPPTDAAVLERGKVTDEKRHYLAGRVAIALIKLRCPKLYASKRRTHPSYDRCAADAELAVDIVLAELLTTPPRRVADGQ